MSALLLLLLLGSPMAVAGELDRLEEPLKTGARSPADAAVVIGAEDYLRVADVPFARRDAQLVYDWLVYSRGVRAEAVQLLDHDVSREAMLAAVEGAAKSVGEGGRLWVYFAGHGAASPESGERLWLGDDVSATPASFAARGLPVAKVHDVATSAGVTAIIVSDACYSGKGRGGEALAAGARFVVPQAAMPAPTTGIVEWDATSTTEIAGPLPGTDHGAFTWFFVGALRGWADGETDGTRDGNVSLEEANLYVSRALRTVQVTAQRPVLIASDTGSSVLALGKEEGPDLATLRRLLGGAAGTGGAVGSRAEAPPAERANAAAPAAPVEPKASGWDVAAAILTGIAAPLGAAPPPAQAEPDPDAPPRPDTSGYAGRWTEVAGGADYYVLASLNEDVVVDSGNGCVTLLTPTQDWGDFLAEEAVIAGTCTPWTAVQLVPEGDRITVLWNLGRKQGTVNLARKEQGAIAAPSGSWTGYFYPVGGGDKVPATLTFSGDSGTIDYLLNDCDTRLRSLPEEGGSRPWLEGDVEGCTAGTIGVESLSAGSVAASWSPPGGQPRFWGILHKK